MRIVSSPFLEVAIQAALASGNIQKKYFGRVKNIQFKSKTFLNLVTEVDHQCEKKILKIIQSHFAHHSFWGEESGKKIISQQWIWVVDPLDGTTNYAHSYPFFCTSIALLKDGQPYLGVIYDALRNELFTAETTHGSYLNKKAIHVSTITSIEKSLLCTGFSYNIRDTHYNFENFKNMVLQSQGVRRDGSAALNLAYIAAGRFDGFWERYLQPWDMAAGILLIQEAGGKISDISGKPFNLFHQNIVATNGKIHSKLLRELLKGADEKLWMKRFQNKML
jgi:myo-inositol-1(or 4)-monophosphatase